MAVSAAPRPWKQAWTEALYGPGGFFIREAPSHHFRTNAAVPLFATAVRRLASLVDRELGYPDPFDLVDVGAGRGELLTSLGDVPHRWRLIGVDIAHASVPYTWTHEIPELTGLLLANEWLDSIPVRVLEDGREVLVDDNGQESLGPCTSSPWCDSWWPGPGRQEEGLSRDEAWAQAVSRVRRGAAVAIDYGHTRAERRPTLTGYRCGRQVLPRPDGSCDLTAHVALDACAHRTGARTLSQRQALLGLGISASLPEAADPSYAGELERSSQARELLDPNGLGAFGWLVQDVGLDAGWMPW